MLLQVQTNPLHPRGVGIEKMTFLNSECIEDGKYDSKWDMRLNFTMGDNNDGISIIDTIERKYCLMNISTYDMEYACVNRLKSLIPSSAEDYVHAYYPEQDQVRDNILCCNQEKFAQKRVIYASTNLKKNYYSTHTQYLQNRCKTFFNE